MLPRFDDIRVKAKTLNKNGDTKFNQEKLEEAFNSYIEAITQLQSIPVTDHTLEDWRNLATYQNNAGVACKDPQQELSWYEKATQNLLRVPEQDRTLEDWRELARYQNNAGVACKDDLQQKLPWYEKAAQNLLLHVPEKDRTLDDWRYLAGYQNNAGVVCMKLSQWKQAQSYFYSTLDALNKAIDNKLIASIYSKLQGMELQYSINKQLYSFAYAVFSGEKQPEVKMQFLQLHLAMINSFSSQPNSSRRGLLQLMQLIESGVNTSHYPNEDVKKWLSDKDNHEQFKKLLQEIKHANEPLSLLNAIDQAPTFSVAVASKLLVLDEIISDLRKEIQDLKKENEQLKILSFFQPKNSSHNQDQPCQEALNGQNMTKQPENNNFNPSFNG